MKICVGFWKKYDFRKLTTDFLQNVHPCSWNYSGTYNTFYFKSLRHYLTKDVLPAESNYRNILSIGGQNSSSRKFSRPTLDELHDESGEVKQQLLAISEKVIMTFFTLSKIKKGFFLWKYDLRKKIIFILGCWRRSDWCPSRSIKGKSSKIRMDGRSVCKFEFRFKSIRNYDFTKKINSNYFLNSLDEMSPQHLGCNALPSAHLGCWTGWNHPGTIGYIGKSAICLIFG